MLNSLEQGSILLIEPCVLEQIGTSVQRPFESFSTPPMANLLMIAREQHLGNRLLPKHLWTRVLGGI